METNKFNSTELANNNSSLLTLTKRNKLRRVLALCTQAVRHNCQTLSLRGQCMTLVVHCQQELIAFQMVEMIL